MYRSRASRCSLKKLLGHSNIYIKLNTYVDMFDKYEKQNNAIITLRETN